MEFVNRNLIKIDRELSDLDKFTLDFIKVLKKHTIYVIISGYVSILLGRSRASEDVDVIIPKMSLEAFSSLDDELRKNDFYCLNAESKDGIYEYLKDKLAVRYAKNNTVIPNMEVKFAKNKIDEITFHDTIKVKIEKEEMIISHLELQIAFKEQVLKSPKDIEDARHLRNVAKDHLNMHLIKEYERILHDF